MVVAPPFGSASAYRDTFPSPPPKNVTVQAETCFNLGLFKDMVRQYRKLDDQIIVRLNRAQAEVRDRTRSRNLAGRGLRRIEGNEGMCAEMWSEMMSGWAHRQTLLSYCLETVNASLELRRSTIGSSGMKEEEVLADQLANEHSIEAIIRKRTHDAFRSRCPFFSPPSDPISKAWWDLAQSAGSGRGPDLPPSS
ncbi:hypothetical protein TREMEDRAFT_69217 [Tremella mesenterica DSM 1558]|uniref:uncharacterized protein n=1 Tax=Tremella mesenterica (strain ATCC 24925 / CBS 8224 / DSM 1558 / NBRC 9311 / NRRL Y-6157 / RJB 2259-6 / UBC 559-6) TaxID=578456 RepID=UPI0003F4A5E7|nr:uncharacterized protein TREMEDRAFT_69217 [Tremella mesenterica DSM 1558]EIW68842.1 hypothetical protein TREMEDRAFT_69217 [Tremella mesenterica DSM 1558]